MKLKISLASLTLVFAGVLSQTVKTPDGPVRGIAEKTFSGRPYYAYYSIPFAKPPIGKRRFMVAEPVDPWTKEHNGTTENPNICFQLYWNFPQENEDCLHLNVFTPVKTLARSASRLPVIVNFHTGAYIAGSGLVSTATRGGINPKYFLEKDIVFVSPNYRLGPFGFLSTGDNVIPGNAGFSDQIQALKWVQKNIAAFGGDPHRVTIMGQSAGASSVGYLMQSPAATGLFRAGILQSGSPLAPWAYQRNHTKIAFKIGSFIDSQFSNSTDSKKLLQVLQGVDAKALDNATMNFIISDGQQPGAAQRYQLQQGIYFTPVIDSKSTKPLLPKLPYEALDCGKVSKLPILIGFCAEEGLYLYNLTIDNLYQAYDENPANLNPQDMHISNESAWNEVGKRLKQEYSPNSTFTENKLGAVRYFTDQDFVRSAVKHAELQSRISPVYLYEFAYSGPMGANYDQKLAGSENVTHGEDTNYIFGAAPPEQYSENDQLVHKRLIEILTNFATHYNPTPFKQELLQNITWPKVISGNFAYVDIGRFSEPNLFVRKSRPKEDRMQFWDNLYKAYAKRPFDTY